MDTNTTVVILFAYQGARLHYFVTDILRMPLKMHEIIEDDPEKALEYIGFLSLLAKSLDEAKRA